MADVAPPTTTEALTPLIEQSVMDAVVVNPDKVLWEGKATRVVVPGFIQELSILPNHTPLYSQLKPGKMVIYPETGSSETIEIDGGIIRVKHNKVSVIVGFETKDEVKTN
jgi:F0F1-type ATP synthase epsilon subunit